MLNAGFFTVTFELSASIVFGFSVNLDLDWIKMDKQETTSSSALSTGGKEWEEIMLFLQLAFICKWIREMTGSG